VGGLKVARHENRAERRARSERVNRVLDETARHLGLQPRRRTGSVGGALAKGTVKILYFAGSEGYVMPPDRHFYTITIRRRWTDARVNVHRNRPISTDRRMRRLRRRLDRLKPSLQGIVVEILDQFDDAVALRKGVFLSRLPPTASSRDMVERIDAMSAYLDRLEAAAT
jgi:hypothetical protein